MTGKPIQAPDAAVGARVRTLRIRRGWSQTRLGERLSEAGVSLGQSNIGRLENGKRSVSIADLYGLAFALDCPPLLLLASDDDTTRVKVGKRGENPSRLRAWVVGRQPLNTVSDPNAYREHAGHLRATGSGMPIGEFLRDLADQLDADSAEGQAETILAAIDYLRGGLRGVRHARKLSPDTVMAPMTREG